MSARPPERVGDHLQPDGSLYGQLQCRRQRFGLPDPRLRELQHPEKIRAAQTQRQVKTLSRAGTPRPAIILLRRQPLSSVTLPV